LNKPLNMLKRTLYKDLKLREIYKN